MMNFNMNSQLQKCLEAQGWKVGTVDKFLGLTKEESAYIELKLVLSEALKARRSKIKSARKAAK